MIRSKLFVPGSRPELFAKALASAADALSFDLEDAVAEGRKGEAREAVATWLASAPRDAAGKTLIVRVNPLDSAHFEADVEAVARSGLALLNLPKVETSDAVRTAVTALERAERANGVLVPIGLLLNIESPAALRRAAELAGAHPRVAGLQLGLGDLFEPLGIARRDTRAVHHAMFTLRMAAGEAGVWALDSAFADIADATGYRAEAEMARACGYAGKSCIHPSQIALANAVFMPTPAEQAHAQRVVTAATVAAAESIGAFTVDGQMVDGPFIARAHAILAAAQRVGASST